MIEDGIFEIRCKVGNNISRVLYFFYFEGKIMKSLKKYKEAQILANWKMEPEILSLIYLKGWLMEWEWF